MFQPFCSGWVSRSSRIANSKSESASSRRGGQSSESYRDGSAQSVHSRAMLKLPRSNSRSRRVSIPAIRRAFKTWKRCPRSGWNGWRISAHPKCELCSGAVRADRRYPQWPLLSVSFRYVSPLHRKRTILACLQRCFDLRQKRPLASLFDGLDRLGIHPRRAAVTAHPPPCFPQNVTPVDPCPEGAQQRMEPACLTPLGTHP